MPLIALHPVNPQIRLVRQIAEVFQKGGLVVYPTDSGYALGCHARHAGAVDRLYHTKREIKKYTMALMVSSFAAINEFAIVETPVFRYLKNHMPGPYTMILPATKAGAKILGVKRKEIGVRMPQHPFFEVLHQVFDEPILNTSARITDDDYFSDAEEIHKHFKGRVDLVVDMGSIEINPTSVISLVSGEPEVLRSA